VRSWPKSAGPCSGIPGTCQRGVPQRSAPRSPLFAGRARSWVPGTQMSRPRSRRPGSAAAWSPGMTASLSRHEGPQPPRRSRELASKA
jgi:hypothetical protein